MRRWSRFSTWWRWGKYAFAEIFLTEQRKVSGGVVAGCVFLRDYVQRMTAARAGVNGSCTVRGRCRFSCERVSGELSACTKAFTSVACGRDASHGLSEPGPLHLSAHPLWNQPPWPTIAMQNTPPCIKHNSNHPQPSPSASPSPFPRPSASASPLSYSE